MNVYDCAHNLASAIKESEEYKQYKECSDKVATNEDLTKMLQDFQQKSMEMQMRQLAGEPMDEETTKSIQQLYGIVMQDPMAATYLQAQMRYSIMMKDVYEILNEMNQGLI